MVRAIRNFLIPVLLGGLAGLAMWLALVPVSCGIAAGSSAVCHSTLGVRVPANVLFGVSVSLLAAVGVGLAAGRSVRGRGVV